MRTYGYTTAYYSWFFVGLRPFFVTTVVVAAATISGLPSPCLVWHECVFVRVFVCVCLHLCQPGLSDCLTSLSVCRQTAAFHCYYYVDYFYYTSAQYNPISFSTWGNLTNQSQLSLSLPPSRLFF